MTIEVDETRLVETMEEQAEIGGTDGNGLHRPASSDKDAEIRAWFVDQVSEAGLEFTVDEFGNTFGYHKRIDPDAGTILVGSHLDSQPYGGIYDGVMGIVAALELVRALSDEGIETKHPIGIVSWTNEESPWFQPAMQDSGVWTGERDIETEYARTDADGEVFEEELERIGCKGDVPVEPQHDCDSYLELHVEQGPYLEENDAGVGTVTGVVGFTWGAITFHGEADHSGPTPIHYRSDALVAATDVITQIRRTPDTLGERTISTTGYVDTKPNSINIIPEEVTSTWGFRDPDEAVIGEVRARVLAEAEATAECEGADQEYEDRMWTGLVRFADGRVDAVELAAEKLGYDDMRIFSGAGYDATHTHKVMGTGMVFSVSKDGKSHSEDEYMSRDDCYKATNTLANAAYKLAIG